MNEYDKNEFFLAVSTRLTRPPIPTTEISTRQFSFHTPARLGMKTVGNDWENLLTILFPVFFSREREPDREWEIRTGKRNWYYSISGTEYFDRESVIYNGNTDTCNHSKELARCNISNLLSP